MSYSSRMVVITFFFSPFGFLTEKFWAILGSSGAIFGSFWAILGGFSGTVRFPHYSSRMVVITYFYLTFEFLIEKFWAILGSSGAFLGHFGPFWRLFRNGSIPALFLADGCYNLFLFDFWVFDRKILGHFGQFWGLFGSFWAILKALQERLVSALFLADGCYNLLLFAFSVTATCESHLITWQTKIADYYVDNQLKLNLVIQKSEIPKIKKNNH